MPNFQQIIVMGHLGKDPELTHLTSGKTVCKFSVAVSETFMKGGEKQQKTEWFNIVAWDKLGENAAKYLAKGDCVQVTGKLETRSWDDKNSGTKKFATDLHAHGMVYVKTTQKTETTGTAGSKAKTEQHDDGADIPF